MGHTLLLGNSKVILVAVLLAVSCCYDLDTERFRNTFGSAVCRQTPFTEHAYATKNVNDNAVIISHFGQHIV